MDSLVKIFSFLVENWQALVSGIVAVLSAIIAIALIIPGPQPESFLQKWVEWLSKFSNKPKP